MNDSKAVKAGQFVKGDSRINRTNGPLTNEAKSWGTGVKNSLARKMKPGEYVDLLLKYAKMGRPWAILEIGERMMDKSTQPLSGEISHTLSFKFGENGNGDAKE